MSFRFFLRFCLKYQVSSIAYLWNLMLQTFLQIFVSPDYLLPPYTFTCLFRLGSGIWRSHLLFISLSSYNTKCHTLPKREYVASMRSLLCNYFTTFQFSFIVFFFDSTAFQLNRDHKYCKSHVPIFFVFSHLRPVLKTSYLWEPVFHLTFKLF